MQTVRERESTTYLLGGGVELVPPSNRSQLTSFRLVMKCLNSAAMLSSESRPAPIHRHCWARSL